MTKVFISYRREDSRWGAHSINNCLVEKFGSENIFYDVDSIPLGVNFKTYLDNAVSQVQLLLVIMDKDWLSITNEDGVQRLADPRDFVRIEIESAFKRNIPVLPVLLEQTQMPSPESLPESLQELAYLNALKVVQSDFDHHIGRLIKHIETLSASPALTTPHSSSPPQSNETVAKVDPGPAGLIRTFEGHTRIAAEKETARVAATQPTNKAVPHPSTKPKDSLVRLETNAVSLVLTDDGIRLGYYAEGKPNTYLWEGEEHTIPAVIAWCNTSQKYLYGREAEAVDSPNSLNFLFTALTCTFTELAQLCHSNSVPFETKRQTIKLGPNRHTIDEWLVRLLAYVRDRIAHITELENVTCLVGVVPGRYSLSATYMLEDILQRAALPFVRIIKTQDALALALYEYLDLDEDEDEDEDEEALAIIAIHSKHDTQLALVEINCGVCELICSISSSTPIGLYELWRQLAADYEQIKQKYETYSDGAPSPNALVSIDAQPLSNALHQCGELATSLNIELNRLWRLDINKLATGGSVQSGVLSGANTDVLLLNHLPYGIEVEAVAQGIRGGSAVSYIPVVEANSTIPLRSQTLKFTTLNESTTSVSFCFYEVIRNGLTTERQFLGTAKIADLAGDQGKSELSLAFDMDANSKVTIHIKENATGQGTAVNLVGRALNDRPDKKRMLQERPLFLGFEDTDADEL